MQAASTDGTVLPSGGVGRLIITTGNASAPRRLNLGVGIRTSAVFRNDEIDTIGFQKRFLRREIEGTARLQEVDGFSFDHLFWPVDGADEKPSVATTRKGSDVLSTDREKHAAPRCETAAALLQGRPIRLTNDRPPSSPKADAG